MRLLLPLLGLLGATLARPNYGYGQPAFGGNTRSWGNQGNTRPWGQGNTRSWGQGNTGSWGQQGNTRPWGGQSASAWSEWTAVSVNQPFLRGPSSHSSPSSYSSHSSQSGHISSSQSSTGHSGHSSGVEYSIDSHRQLQGVQPARAQGLFRGTVGRAQSTTNIEVLAAGHSAPTDHAVIITNPDGGQGYNPGGQDISILPGNLGEGWALPPVQPGVQPAPLPLQARLPAPAPCSAGPRPSPCGSSCGRGAWGRPCAAGCSSPCSRPLAPARPLPMQRPLPMPMPRPMPSPCQAAPQMGPLLGPIASTGCGRADRWTTPAPAPRPGGCSTGGCGK